MPRLGSVRPVLCGLGIGAITVRSHETQIQFQITVPYFTFLNETNEFIRYFILIPFGFAQQFIFQFCLSILSFVYFFLAHLLANEEVAKV